MENQEFESRPQAQNVIIVQQQKSVGTSLILAIIFGPLGLFYASITGGIIMLIISLIVGFITFGFGLIFTNIICAIWAVVAVNNSNNKMNRQYQ
jgi:hypothetical protein